MTRSIITLLLAALLLGGAAVAHAADGDTIKGDKSNGRTLIYTCAGCHGVPGYKNVYPTYSVPLIAGQNETYIRKALHEYKSGKRKHPTMDAQAESLSDQEIADIAAYLSSISPDDD